MSGWSERPVPPPAGTAYPAGGTPSAQELMMFADGELDERRAAEVLWFLQSHPEQRARLDNARLASDVLVGGLLARADAQGADRLVGEIMARVTGEAMPSARERFAQKRRRKQIMGTAVVLTATLAAAASLLLFVRVGPWVRRAVQIATETTKSAPSAVAAIQVEAVDFGARAGTIFYVKSGDKSSTPVLWVTDDEQAAEAGLKQTSDAGVER